MMFCPRCGNPDQQPETFCRRCGGYLPDFEKIKNKQSSPEDHLRANAFLNLLTAVVSLSLAVALYAIFLGREDTPFIIYLTAGFLTAIFAWQVQTFWRTQLLKKHFRSNAERKKAAEAEAGGELPAAAPELLAEADFKDIVGASVTERTTKNLTARRPDRSS